jgi:ribosome-interacting GTPase 1
VPANLSQDYIAAEKEYKAATTSDDKMLWLQKMLSTIPKHKGTEKMQADIKRRIAQLKERHEKSQKKKGPSFRVKPEGAGQISLIGPPNSGKSALVAALTHAEPEVAAYPFTTREPIPGMVPYKDVLIQLLDLPPLSREHCESFVFDNIRGSDGVLLVLDMGGDDPVEEYHLVKTMLEEKRIHLVPPDSDIPEVKGIEIFLRTILIFNKCDIDPDHELHELILDMLETNLPILRFSSEDGTGFDELPKSVFDLLHIIRVYSKQPGKEPDMDAPFTVPMGSTVEDLAYVIHKDIAANMKSARIWGSGKFDGQVVQHDHVLQDKDVIEISV